MEENDESTEDFDFEFVNGADAVMDMVAEQTKEEAFQSLLASLGDSEYQKEGAVRAEMLYAFALGLGFAADAVLEVVGEPEDDQYPLMTVAALTGLAKLFQITSGSLMVESEVRI